MYGSHPMGSPRTLRAVLGALLAFAALALAAPGQAAAVTYAANCGHTGFLKYKPKDWSNGCTGGAFNIERIRWSRWGTRSARGSGRTLFRDPLCRPTCPEARYYKYRARITMRRRRTCSSDDGDRRRYFSRVTVRVRYPSGNPFGERAGWKTQRFSIPSDGPCDLSP